MVATIDTACSDSDDDSTHSSSVGAPAAKRANVPEGGSPAHKARRKTQDKHAVRHLRTSPKIADGKVSDKAERLEPGTLEERLCFVSPAGDANGSNSQGYFPKLVRQMQKMCIAQIQEAQQQMAQQGQENNILLPSNSDSVSTPEKTRGREGVWQMCVKPSSEKDIHTTEEDGWQIVEEYGEKTPPRCSRSPSPERASDKALAPSEGNPVMSRSDTASHFCWVVNNLPYPASTYSVTVEKQHIVIRTTNRKYYKRIDLPELSDRGLQLYDKLLTWSHSQETLTVSYTKPTTAEN